MKKALLILIFLTGLTQETMSQDPIGKYQNLKFQSALEERFFQSGESNPFQLFRAVQAEYSQSNENWTKLLDELDLKSAKRKDDYRFLRQIFEKTHQILLKKYEQHSTFNSMLKEGKFDCVSGSAALSLVLERYGYSIDIVETDYHVFIIAHLADQKVILESTLPIGGLISTPTEVEKYLSSYKPNQSESSKVFNQRLAGTDVSLLDNSIFRTVNLQELAGLQYYNDAIVHFNAQEYELAIDQLNKAYLLYPSERILGLLELSQELTISNP